MRNQKHYGYIGMSYTHWYRTHKVTEILALRGKKKSHNLEPQKILSRPDLHYCCAINVALLIKNTKGY